MSGTVREARLGTPTARVRLKPGRQPHWNAVIAGKAHLGYQRRNGDKIGRWILRQRRDGSYSEQQIGMADDDRSKPADGVGTLTYDQARAKALDLAGGAAPSTKLTVIKVIAD